MHRRARRAGALLLVGVSLAPVALAAGDDHIDVPVAMRLGQTWRWREIDRPREAPRFVSVVGDGSGALFVVDDAGLWRYDGRGFSQRPGWETLGGYETRAVSFAQGGLLVGRDEGLSFLPEGRVAPAPAFDAAGHPRPAREAFRVGEPAPTPPRVLHPWVTADGSLLTVLGDEIVVARGATIVRRLPPPRDAQVAALAEDSRGRLLCGTTQGVFLERGGRWESLAGPGPVLAHALPRGDEVVMLCARFEPDRAAGYAWDGETLRPLPSPPVDDDLVDATRLPDDVLVASMSRGDLLVLEDDAWTRADVPAHFERTFVALSAAEGGRLALVDRAGRLRVCDLQSHRWSRRDPSLAPEDARVDPVVNALCASARGGVWIGTHEGVVRWDRLGFVDAHLVAGDTGVALRGVTAVREDARGHLWVGSGGTFRGALEYDGARWTHHAEPEGVGEMHVHRIVTAPDGSLWFMLVTGDKDDWRRGGIASFDGERWTAVYDGTRTYDVVFDDDGAPIVATLDGVLVRRDGRWVGLGESLGRHTSFALHRASDGTLRRGHGVDVRGVERYDAVRDAWVRDEGEDWALVGAGAFAEDHLGRVWCASAFGLFLIDGRSCMAVPTGDVLATPSYWPLLATDGGMTLWIGGPGGLLEYAAEDGDPPCTEPIQEHVVPGDPTHPEVSWLGADTWHDTPRRELRYRVRVDGGDWSEPTADTGGEFDLTAGTHVVEVETVDLDGNVSARPGRLEVVVPEPFWRQPPALVGWTMLAGVLATLGGVLARRARERREAEAVQTELAARLRRLSRGLMREQDVERRALARDLTDDLGQLLAAANLQLDRCARESPTAANGPLAAARGALGDALGRVRRLASDVRPSLLDDLGVDVAVRALADAFADETGLPVEVEIDLGASDLPGGAADHLYRILQECLANVHRHAEASLVEIGFVAGDDGTRLEVRDDGRGFDPSSTPLGMGLLAARERAADAGGTLEIDSRPGRGTVIRVSIPGPGKRRR